METNSQTQRRRPRNLSPMIEELHQSEEKQTLLEDRRDQAKLAIRHAKELQAEAQRVLDTTTVNYQRKVKTFQLLDEILAEFKFSQKVKAEQKAKAVKRLTKPQKTPEQTMADVMACLKALPESQRAMVISAMETKQGEST